MSIRSKRIRKVIIAGNWFTVATDSFEIVDMEFTDDDGNAIHAEAIPVQAYRFVTDNGDLYYGPLSSIDLFKLVEI